MESLRETLNPGSIKNQHEFYDTWQLVETCHTIYRPANLVINLNTNSIMLLI